MKKIFAALAVSCAAVVAFAGCGGGDKRETFTVEELVAQYGYQWTDTSKPILNAEGAKKFSFNVYSSKNAAAIDYNDMKIMQTLYETTNVFVDWNNVSESTYNTQKNLIFGNGEKPDALYHAGLSAGEIVQYASRKVILPISDYLKYMPNFSKILEERPDIKKQLTNVKDGKIYALPRIEEMGLKQNPNLLFLNKNWAKTAVQAGAVTGITEADIEDGLQLTSTQMEAMLKYFKDNDMNGNGSNDERPMTFVYNNWQGNQCDLYGMFGINDNLEHRVIKDGKVTYTVLDDAFRTATNFIGKWAKANLIDQVSFEQSQNDFIANGKGVEKYGAFYWWESETIVTNPANYIVCKPLIGPNGDQTISVSNSQEIETGELVIFKKCPNPELLLTYFDRYYMPEISAQINYGPVGVVYEEEKDAGGKLVQKPIPQGTTADELRFQNAPFGICYLSDYAWENVVNMEPRAALRVERLAQYATPYVPANVKPVPNLQFTAEELRTISNYESTVNDFIKTRLIKWLRGEEISESAWNSFKSEIQGNGVGLKKVQKVYQDAYDRYVAEN